MVFFKVALAQLHYCTARGVYAWISGGWFALYKWLPPRCDKSAHLDYEALLASATIAECGARAQWGVGGVQCAPRPREASCGGARVVRAPREQVFFVYKIYRGFIPSVYCRVYCQLYIRPRLYIVCPCPMF